MREKHAQKDYPDFYCELLSDSLIQDFYFLLVGTGKKFLPLADSAMKFITHPVAIRPSPPGYQNSGVAISFTQPEFLVQKPAPLFKNRMALLKSFKTSAIPEIIATAGIPAVNSYLKTSLLNDFIT